MDLRKTVLGKRAQFLRQTTVKRHRSITEVQALRGHQLHHPGLGRRKIHSPPREQLLQRLPFERGLGMEREMGPPQLQFILLVEPFHTNGAEVAPRSHVVGEHFKLHERMEPPPDKFRTQAFFNTAPPLFLQDANGFTRT